MKKGQTDIVYIVASIIAIIFVTLILVKITGTLNERLVPAFKNVSVEAGNATSAVLTTYINWADTVAIIAIVFSIMLLFIFSFMVDIHPIFLILYVVLVMFLAIFSPYIIGAVEDIYLSAEMASATAELPATFWFIEHFGIILLAIIIVSGIILFAKLRSTQGGGF